MSKPFSLSQADHLRISEAVSHAEAGTAGEVVTVLADRSDGYTDVALCWAVLVAMLALIALAIAPDFFLVLVDRLTGDWAHDWTAGEMFSLAGVVAALGFGGMMLLQLVDAIRFALVPGPIKLKRVHDRALQAFRIGAEQRTSGRTGVLIYLSMREHRAEVLGDAAIAAKVDAQVWHEALEALLARVREGDVAGGMGAAIERVGAILSEHFPRQDNDINELPDRLIEV